MKIKNFLISLIVGIFLVQGFGYLIDGNWVMVVKAQEEGEEIIYSDDQTLLPFVHEDADCEIVFLLFDKFDKNDSSVDMNAVLGCAIRTGRISLDMIPYFLRYFSNYFLGLVSLISLLFTVIGGYLYIASGLSPEQKDKGKSYIKNALIGMAMAFLAWSIVNVIISALTG